MKKILIVFVALSFTFASCKNENVANPQITLGKATVTGTVYANLDKTNDGSGVVYEKVVGKTVVASVSTKDLVSNPGTGTYGTKYYTATTDSNGKYSIDVDVRSDIGTPGMTVTLIPQDFEVLVPPSTTTTTLFLGSSVTGNTVKVYNGGTFLLNLTYN